MLAANYVSIAALARRVRLLAGAPDAGGLD